ncbi:hypothetical protein [Pararhodobacter oceanensis]|uniref:hypothetical protein n=1 Tax=Pararhodobacter oceanensis TaxID=2172121 RepID=UPI003A90631F
MFQPRSIQPKFASVVADLEVIARIETSITSSKRRAPTLSHGDFSRLARYIPDLRV